MEQNPQIWIENFGEIMVSEDKFYWMIPAVFTKFTGGSCMVSPYFSFDQEDWRLILIPSDGEESVQKNCSHWGLFLHIKSCNTPKQKYDVRLTVENIDGEEIFESGGDLDAYYGYGTWDFLELDNMDDCYFSGRVIIHCSIKNVPSDLLLGSDSENEEKEQEISKKNDDKQKSEPKGVHRLVHNFRNLLDNESSCDVVLKTNDHEFRAHQVILGASSPVFSAMFQHDMAEKKTCEVDISDCSTSGFKAFLLYLYSGNTDTMTPSNVLDLYYIADKYQVSDLKSDCVEYMQKNLAVHNFCDVMALSLKHNERDLQRFATRFFSRNIKKIIKTVQWRNYITENPIQANELIIKTINA